MGKDLEWTVHCTQGPRRNWTVVITGSGVRGEGPGRGRKLGGIRRRAETKLMEEWKENVKRIRKRSEFVVHESECVMIIIYKLRN